MAKPLGTKPRNTSFNGGSQHGFEIPTKHLNQNEDGNKENRGIWIKTKLVKQRIGMFVVLHNTSSFRDCKVFRTKHVGKAFKQMAKPLGTKQTSPFNQMIHDHG